MANYITVPANVEWQATAKKFKNDPLWAGGSLGYYTPSGWLNDKVWLPSIYEVFDRTVADNSGQTLRFSGDGGLWELSDDERKNYAYSWLRTAYPFGYCSYMFHLTSPGTNVDYVSYVDSTSCTIRPALHLNLSKAVKNSAPSHTHQFGEWNITIPATCADVGERTRTCSAEDCPLVNGIEKEEIPALGHDFAVDFTIDTRATCTHTGSKSRHCVRSDCSEKTDITEIPISAHEYTNYISNNDATCLADGTKTAGCDYGCGTEDTITDVGTQLSHTWSSDWSKDGTNHWHECTLGCGTNDGKAAHSYTWVVDTPATITSTGIQHEECVCGERRSENTVIPVLTCSHTNKTHVAGVAATCMTAGTVEYWICSDCNKNIDGSGMEITDLVIPVDPAAHGYTNYVSDGNATCLADGTKTATCGHGCGATDTVTDTGSKLAHAWSADWNKDTANHWRECMRGCGTKHGEAAHAYKWVVDSPATMTSTGLKHEECVCGEKRSENTVIPVETCSHANKTHIAAVAVTCVAAGNPEYWHCNDCKKNLDGSGLEISTLIIPIDPDAHNWGAWVQTVAPSYTEDGEERRECQNTGCSHFEMRTVSILNKAQAVISNFELNDLEYGDIISPAATTSHGTVKFTYSNRLDGTYTATMPKNVGTYYVKASVEEGETYLGTEEIITFNINPREISVAINAGSSVLGAALETLTATVTSGSIVSGDDPYTLSTNADKDVLGTYAITGTCTDYNYSITFADGVYIVSQRASDPSGGGEIDIPTDIDVEFKVTQSSTSNSYSELAGLKKGYWAQLWYRNEDGTLGDEFTDKMNCVLTLKIPTEIIKGILRGEKIDRDKIAAGLTVYYVDSDGDYIKIKPFTIAQKEDESWIIKFNYNEKFPAEIVFNAPDAEQEGASAKSGIPWWVWLLVGLGGATLITVIIVAVVLSKRKKEEKTVTVQGGTQYDDA
ncbi:MAG: hypothetical protein K2J54_01935, partial [Clostridia bacterium]|nr:hypothetical protein [Clostridia bacterium]